jgi:hypothetical protein
LRAAADAVVAVAVVAVAGEVVEVVSRVRQGVGEALVAEEVSVVVEAVFPGLRVVEVQTFHDRRAAAVVEASRAHLAVGLHNFRPVVGSGQVSAAVAACHLHRRSVHLAAIAGHSEAALQTCRRSVAIQVSVIARPSFRQNPAAQIVLALASPIAQLRSPVSAQAEVMSAISSVQQARPPVAPRSVKRSRIVHRHFRQIAPVSVIAQENENVLSAPSNGPTGPAVQRVGTSNGSNA